MKISLLAVVVILLLIPAVSYGLYSHTSQLCQELDHLLVQLNQKAENEEWNEAVSKTKKVNKKWEQADSFWSPYIDHQEIDLIDESVAKINVLVEIENREDLLVEIGLARRLLLRLKESETPDFQNVF